jgi:two-component system response regulator YesN
MEAFTIEKRLCKILIVDDEILIRQGIKHYMNWEEEGFAIIGEAANGREALHMIEHAKPDIVITDIVMPVMDGEELTRAIKTRHPDIEVVVLSSFGEFEYVRSSFQSGVADYILKPKLEPRELLNVLNKAIGRAGKTPEAGRTGMAPSPSAERLLEKIAAGFEMDEEIDRELVRRTFPHPVCRLFAWNGKRIPDDAAARLARLIGEHVPGAVCAPFAAFRNMTALFANGDDGLRLVPDSLAERWSRETGHVGPLLVSLPYGEFLETGEVLQAQIRPLARHAFYHPDERLLTWSESLAAPSPVEAFNLNQFTEEMKRMQFDSAFTGLRQHVDRLCANGNMEVEEFRSFLNNMIFTITVLAENIGFDTQGLEKEKFRYFEAIEQAQNAREAAGTLHAFMEEASSVMASALRKSSAGNLQKLLAYIEQNYAEPLSLKDVARHFHFNPSYLSSYFSTHSGEGFIEYVNKIRVGKAAEMLRTGSDTIAEIGAKVGFSDHSYFCRVFKKFTGHSPSQYRRLTAGSGTAEPDPPSP